MFLIQARIFNFWPAQGGSEAVEELSGHFGHPRGSDLVPDSIKIDRSRPSLTGPEWSSAALAGPAGASQAARPLQALKALPALSGAPRPCPGLTVLGGGERSRLLLFVMVPPSIFRSLKGFQRSRGLSCCQCFQIIAYSRAGPQPVQR